MFPCLSENNCCRKFVFFLTFILLVIILEVSLSFGFNPIDISYFRVTLVPHGCPRPARFHVSAEPELYQIWKEADAYLLAGGSNLFPGKAAFHSVLIGACCQDKIFRRGGSNKTRDASLKFKSIVNRTFADVSYRSSYCQERRENLVATVRRKVEAAGFTFKAEGLCGGAGYPRKENFKGRGEWTKCGKECTDSKIMLSFERFQEGHEYVSEKLFIPLEYGAIPAYFGNGQQILNNILKVNRKAFIDRNDFDNDEAYADKIVDLLRHPEELQRMQDEPVFHDVDMAKKRVMFFQPVGHYDQDAAPELYHVLRDSAKFKKFINRTDVSIRATGVNQIPVLKHVLNITSIKRVHNPKTCVDIEVHGCCFRRRL